MRANDHSEWSGPASGQSGSCLIELWPPDEPTQAAGFDRRADRLASLDPTTWYAWAGLTTDLLAGPRAVADDARFRDVLTRLAAHGVARQQGECRWQVRPAFPQVMSDQLDKRTAVSYYARLADEARRVAENPRLVVVEPRRSRAAS